MYSRNLVVSLGFFGHPEVTDKAVTYYILKKQKKITKLFMI